MRRWRSRMTAITGCTRRSTPGISTGRCSCPGDWPAAPLRSTASPKAISRRRSAAISARARWRATRAWKPWGSTCRRRRPGSASARRHGRDDVAGQAGRDLGQERAMDKAMSMDSSTRAQIERFYDGTLLPDEMVATMSTDGGWFPSRTIARASTPSVLKRSGQALPPLAIQDHGTSFDLYDYLSVNRVAGLMVLRDGEVVQESYSLGIGPQTMWNSCSLAKSVAATLVGIALREGAIASLDDPVTRYAPLGGVYAQVSIRQLLRMASGIRWREAY